MMPSSWRRLRIRLIDWRVAPIMRARLACVMRPSEIGPLSSWAAFSHHAQSSIVGVLVLFVFSRHALARTQRAGHGGIARIRIGIAPARSRGDLFAGDGGGLADQAAAGAAHQIDVGVR